MPHFTFYDGTSIGPEWGVSTDSGSFTAAQIQQDYEEYRQECEHQDRIYEQQMQMMEQQMEEERQKEEQLKEDKRKYPLFFLKKGIV